MSVVKFFRSNLRKIYIAIIAYLVSFLVGIINARILGVNLSTASSVPTAVWIMGILAQLVLMLLFSLWYFAKSPSPNLKEGLFFGLTCVIVGFIIDVLVIIPSILLSRAPASVAEYYGSPFFWLSLALTVAIPALIGRMRQNTASPK